MMNREKAIEILGEENIHEDGGLHNSTDYFSWSIGDNRITLDDKFTAEQLEAIVWWVKNHSTINS